MKPSEISVRQIDRQRGIKSQIQRQGGVDVRPRFRPTWLFSLLLLLLRVTSQAAVRDRSTIGTVLLVLISALIGALALMPVRVAVLMPGCQCLLVV